MQLSLERSGDVRIVRVNEPKLTYPVLSAFFDQVREVVAEGARKLVIDLEVVAYIDSASIGCLMDIHRLFRQQDGALELTGLQPRVETLLSMTGVLRIIDVHRKASEALAGFA